MDEKRVEILRQIDILQEAIIGLSKRSKEYKQYQEKLRRLRTEYNTLMGGNYLIV